MSETEQVVRALLYLQAFIALIITLYALYSLIVYAQRIGLFLI